MISIEEVVALDVLELEVVRAAAPDELLYTERLAVQDFKLQVDVEVARESTVLGVILEGIIEGFQNGEECVRQG